MLIRIREKNQDSRDVPLAAADAFAKTSSERCASGTTPPIARHPAPTKASVFARSRPCSYACQSRGTRARAASRPRGRLSRGRAGTRTRPRLLFPANLVDRNSRASGGLPSRTPRRLRRRSSRPRRAGFLSGSTSTGRVVAWSESRLAGRSGFDVARVSRDADLVGWFLSRFSDRSVLRRARSDSASRRARDARGRRSSRRPSRDSHSPRARARSARRARTGSSSFRVQIRVVRRGGNIRGVRGPWRGFS